MRTTPESRYGLMDGGERRIGDLGDGQVSEAERPCLRHVKGELYAGP
ncbi:hypothetical protein [Streptomyces sp. OE57]